MINNFDLLSKFIAPETEDDFWFVQILKRKKEHPELKSNSYVVKTYYIKNIEDLNFYKDEMICLATFHNARVGINLNKRSFKSIAFNTLKKVSDQILNQDYKNVRASYNSVCGNVNNEQNKKWIIDIDDLNFNALELKNFLYKLDPYGDKFLAHVPTKNGYHIITSPFNTQQFKYAYPEIDIHKDNPTLLFIS